MELSGNYQIEAPRDTVWKLLMDTDAIAKALPGVEQMVPVEGEDNTWRADVKLSVGAISGTYSGLISMSDIEAMEQYRLSVKGEGQQSIIDGSALISLDYDEAERATTINWNAEANISGKLASIGQRVITSTANMMSRRFFSSLAQQLEEPEPPAETMPPPSHNGKPASAVPSPSGTTVEVEIDTPRLVLIAIAIVSIWYILSQQNK